MIYGSYRVIYLLRKHDIISVPLYAKRISSAKQISYLKGILSVPAGTDIIVKTPFVCGQKRFLLGAGDGNRTCNLLITN